MLGLFPKPATSPTGAVVAGNLFPEPIHKFYFDGTLCSVSPPLRSNPIEFFRADFSSATVKSAASVLDTLHPYAVTLTEVDRADPVIPSEMIAPMSAFWGRLTTPTKQHPAGTLGRTAVQEQAWRIDADELRAMLSSSPAQAAPPPAPSIANPAPVASARKPDTAPAPQVDVPEPITANWKMRTQAEAHRLFLVLRASGANPTVHSILDQMASWCRKNDVKASRGTYPSAEYLRVHVLSGKHWQAPTHSVEQAIKALEQIEQIEQTKVEQTLTK